MAQIIYKICTAVQWHEAEHAGSFAGASIDLLDGYIHFSTGAQIVETCAKHFAGMHDLVIFAVDADAFGDRIRWEKSRGGDLFPHLYGTLPLAHVLWTKPLPILPNGRHVFPEGMTG